MISRRAHGVHRDVLCAPERVLRAGEKYSGEMNMKMIMIAYNEAVDMEVMEVLESCCLTNYTKVAGTFGKGTSSGIHLGTDIWPGLNNILFAACEDAAISSLLAAIKELRKTLAKEGVKAFVLPLEEMT